MSETIKKGILFVLLLPALCACGMLVVWILDLIFKPEIRDIVSEGCMSGLRAWVIIGLILIGKKVNNKC